MSPIHTKHDEISRYLATLLATYFELKPLGIVKQAPFVMHLPNISRREPDLQIILQANFAKLQDTELNGAADIVIEIVSSESVQRDYADKLHEYEKGKVSEYWIVDPLQNQCRFYRLNAQNMYVLQTVATTYTTPLLPKLEFDPAILWQNQLPGPVAIVQAVQKMLEN